MLEAYVLTFCRVVIALAFAVSSTGKARNLAAFQQAIINFGILPLTWGAKVAWPFLIGEITVVILVVLGETFMQLGFLLATFLLTIFSAVLIIALLRKKQIACNCFGYTDKRISWYDLVRNGSFIVCSVLGLSLCWSASGMSNKLNWGDFILAGLPAISFVIMQINLAEIVQLYRRPEVIH
jgi:hypothetical protein